MNVPILSTGEPSTLGNWLRLTSTFFGNDSPATNFWQEKITESEAEGNGGADEAVLQDERQCMYLNMSLHRGTV